MSSATLYLLPFLPMAGAAILPFIYSKRKKAGFLLTVLLSFIELLLAGTLLFSKDAEVSTKLFGGLFLACDGFRAVYLCITAFMWLTSALCSPCCFKKEPPSLRYLFFWLITLGATMGLFLAGDFLTLYLFFELLSLSSYLWIVEEQTKECFLAGKTYLIVAVLGGMVLLMGIFLLNNTLHTLVFSEIEEALKTTERSGLYPAGLCLLFGFGAKAGLFPLHIWLPKAHPVAPAPASALLSGILTKAGIFGLLLLSFRVFAGDFRFGLVLLLLGAITMFWGAFLAILNNNLKGTLACSSVSQIGFITLGLGSAMILSSKGSNPFPAISGSLLHMMNHSFLKLSLFLLAGVFLSYAGSLKLKDLRGAGRRKPFLCIAFLIGALGIGGFPLLNGYISKTLLHHALSALGSFSSPVLYKSVEWLFVFSGGMTVCYMTKLFIVLFVEKNPQKQEFYNQKKVQLPFYTKIALALSSLAILLMGVPSVASLITKKSLPFFKITENVAPHFAFSHIESLKNIGGAFLSIGIGILLYFLVVWLFLRKDGSYPDVKPAWFDLEKSFYTPLFQGILLLLQVLSLVFFLPELLVKWIGKTFFLRGKDKKVTLKDKADTCFEALLEKRFGKADEKEPALVRAKYTFLHTSDMIFRSFSFTIATTCVGLVAILIYMILF